VVQSSGIFGPEFSFRAPPLAGPGATVHILALADQGVGEQPPPCFPQLLAVLWLWLRLRLRLC
jgi:hypothetical protein